MIILAATVELYLPGVGSLKEKRGILKSLIAQVHKKFNVAVAEVDLHDAWQSSTLGIAVVSTASSHAESVLENILGWIERNRPDLEIVTYTEETISINPG